MPERFWTVQCKNCKRWDNCDHYEALEMLEDAVMQDAEAYAVLDNVLWLKLSQCPIKRIPIYGDEVL